MKLWEVIRKGPVHGGYSHCVVRAATEHEARQLVANELGGTTPYNRDPWLHGGCYELEPHGTPQILLRVFSR